MSEMSSSAFENNSLYLVGHLQIEIARTALLNINPDAAKMLGAYLALHSTLSTLNMDVHQSGGVRISMSGDTAKKIKTDIITGLNVINDTDAQALREILEEI